MDRKFEDDVKLNKYRLPEECEMHSGNYHYWADLLAKAKGMQDFASDRLKLVLAEEEMSIRTEWESKYVDRYGKMTESGVKAVLEMNDEVQGAKKEVRDSEKEVYTLEAGMRAMDHKKSMLDNLTQLLIKGFYSAPNGTKKENITDQVSKDARKGLNKKEE